MFRPALSSDLDLVVSCVADDPVRLVDAERVQQDFAQNQYRLAWTWLALTDDRLLARALWWGPADHDHPVALDCLWVDGSVDRPEDLGADLLAAGQQALVAAGAQRLPDFHLDVPTHWREDPAAAQAVGWRTRAAARVGLTERIDRLSFAWEAGTPLPARSTRLVFRPGDDAAFLDAFARVAVGSLDILTTRNLAAMGPHAQAQDDLDFYLGLPGHRDWWRLAHAPDGTLVGLVIPSRSAYDASVSYLGVVPEARGRGYAHDLLAEITHVHASAGATRITGTTDTTNVAMGSAFHRAGYSLRSTRIVLSAPA